MRQAIVWAVAGLVLACGEEETRRDWSTGGATATDASTSSSDGSTTGGAATGGGSSTAASGNRAGSGGGRDSIVTAGEGAGHSDSAGAAGGPEPSASGGGSNGGSASGGTTAGGSSSGSRPSGGSAAGGSPSGGSSTSGSSNTGGAQPDPSAGAGGQGPDEATGGAVSGAAGGTAADPDRIVTFNNGGFWQDTEGGRIEAHGAGLIQVGDSWYWIGEDKSHNSGNFRAVNCYASKDLVTWEFRNAIITRDTAPELNATDRIIERPKVVYNDTTKKYVVWLHYEGQNYATAEAGVFTCDTVDGDYTFVRSFRPNNNMSRDDTLFKDDDGKAYFLSAANENRDLAVYELNAEYTHIARQVTTLWAGSSREAPAVFKVDSRYFLVTSGCTGWDPNQQKYSTATSITGPWSALTNLGDSTGYDTQSTFVLPVQGSRATTTIYMGDRWQDPDLASSKYIWLPLKVNGTKLVLDYYDTWQLNLTTGEWSAGDDKFVSQSGWSLVSVDSEETAGEDGSAENAFDDSSSTFWHTQWDGAQPTHPHEIQIDLGASYALTGMQYTPRQDKDENGMVAQYEFYVSDSTSTWGSAVASGTFGTTRTPTQVSFAAKSGRYIRLVALSEINGKAYTSVAEIDVVGTVL